uniref:Smu17B n=1 Tax=uncultured organism TaxID=155900 RepID=Q0GNI7_9ZZZZ|nr:Smu17B [uncultured organism]
MPRRVSLPGADELFRTTGGAALQAPQPRQHTGGEGQSPAQGDPRLRPVPDEDTEPEARQGGPGAGAPGGTAAPSAGEHSGRETPPAPRRPMPAERTVGLPSAATAVPVVTATVAPQVAPVQKPGPPPITATPQAQPPGRRKAPRQNRRPSGRERHDEKITVYVSAEELMDLEHARLVLRGEHGLAIDRGRIVREAVAVVLADLESRGDASILVRRLRGR